MAGDRGVAPNEPLVRPSWLGGVFPDGVAACRWGDVMAVCWRRLEEPLTVGDGLMALMSLSRMPGGRGLDDMEVGLYLRPVREVARGRAPRSRGWRGFARAEGSGYVARAQRRGVLYELDPIESRRSIQKQTTKL